MQQQVSTVPAARASEGGDAAAAAADWLPKLALLGAAFLWGSYSPAVKLLYTTPSPPDVSVVMAVRGVLQAGTLLTVSLALSQQQRQQGGTADAASSSASSNANDGAAAEASGSGRMAADSSAGGAAHLLRRWLYQESPPLWMAALELGFYNFAATTLQTLSLQLISATRASFLVQATLLLTPLLSAAAGYKPAPRVWAGCGLALAGCLLITADEAAGDVAASHAAGLSLGGDTAILASALFYSLGVVRVAGYARSLPSVQLATSKSLALGGLSLASLLVAVGSTLAQGGSPAALWGGWDQPAAWAPLVWAGLGPGALASYLHIQGQKHVAPAQAQVIFSSKPLWSASLAWVLLGGEELGPLTWVGGSALVAAGLVASSGEQQGQQAQQQAQQAQDATQQAQAVAASKRE